MLNWFKKIFRLKDIRSVGAIFDQYELKKPAHQNAIDALPGWNSAFPEEFGLAAGRHHLYADGRIEWALQIFGSIEKKTVLEVGPLEGMHTYRLNLARPARLDAIEANRLCFLRCLVTDQVLNIDRATFYLGDIREWLKSEEMVYDLAIASGVLYHMEEPAEFLKSLSLRSNAVFIWTHYFLDEAMPPDDVRRIPFSGQMETRLVEGLAVRHYERSYQHANTNASFCGGMVDRHFWLHRDDIISLLKKLGYDEVIVNGEDPNHPGGPCFSIFARRTNGLTSEAS